MSSKQLYRNIGIDEIPRDLYFSHASAMTSENLHSKAEIATELAARDQVIKEMKTAITETLEENGHLADGENCTLIKLKRVISQT